MFLCLLAANIYPQTVDTTFFNGLSYRGIGPFRGGRSCAVAGVPSNQSLFYFGSTGGGVWKSENAGTTWKNISDNKGMPKATIGIIGVSVSKADPQRVYALIEALEGGLFRSDDGGGSWNKINEDRNLRQRAWYYTRLYSDPANKDIVYVLNVGFWKSKDGGKSFESIRTPHGDHHDLWINPDNPDNMIIGDDGGAQVSLDGAKSWSTMYNQPTAQFYRVTTDDHFPYRIYGAQQDNSTVRIFHRTESGSIGERDWESTAGAESGWIAIDPNNNDVVYGGNYAGLIGMKNHRTNETRTVDVWPDSPMGHGAKDWKYRFQWNFPLVFSLHDSKTLYAAGNVLFKTTNGGENWDAISGDLTRNDSTKLVSSGGPITKDNTGVEYYCTIFSLAESPIKNGIIWTGSDDGLIHITTDGGKNWKNVTPPENLLPGWAQINSIEANPFNEGGLYVAATRYKSDDYRPYILKTEDFGRSWKKIVNGIGSDHFTRVVRADSKRQGLLFAGTEQGIYISFNEGVNWQTFQLNLPTVPITDLTVKNEDLIVATQGRSFWMIDDISPLRFLNADVMWRNTYLYPSRDTYRIEGSGRGDGTTSGLNLQSGVILNYFFKEMPDSNSVQLKISDSDGKVIKSFKPKNRERGDRLPIKKGLQRFIWNMRYPDAERFDGLILWGGGGLSGPLALPGEYKVTLINGKDSISVPFIIKKDPRSSATMEDLKAQFDFVLDTRDKLTLIHRAIKEIRNIRKQIMSVNDRIKNRNDTDEIKKSGDEITKKITAVEETLYQTKNKSGQDPLNYPVRLNDKLASLNSSVADGQFKPTEQAHLVKKELVDKIDAELLKLKSVIAEDIPKFNKLFHDIGIPAVVTDPEKDL
ncbi:MAG: glycosyl hydrolase [Ignavibacteriae bacterium HGW-Ignavibacteriae-3]|nr:MAG: glycosyl hydrolase [Ignavibacteriae bacterium HGW-Ignavibacteriae-3]